MGIPSPPLDTRTLSGEGFLPLLPSPDGLLQRIPALTLLHSANGRIHLKTGHRAGKVCLNIHQRAMKWGCLRLRLPSAAAGAERRCGRAGR